MTNQNKSRRKHKQAWAPYNFVPLQKSNQFLEGELKAHDIYNGHSGYFDVTLTTESPTYIRGMLTPDEKKRGLEAKDKSEFFSIDGKTPMIPGSSLHGMLRNMLEIISFGKVHFVSDSHKMFFRAVAADKTDPLKYPYENIIGKFGRNVKAGYLHYEKGDWYIQPALKYDRDAYAKVKDETKRGHIPVSGVKNMKRFNHPDYEIQYYDVVFKAQGNIITQVNTPTRGEEPMGVLVCTGNMAETQQAQSDTVDSPRKNYALILNPNANAKRIPIDSQAIKDYVEGLSAFQKKKPFDETYGMLKHGRPVFYIDEGNYVIQFGHTPNFRVAPRVQDADGFHAVTPLDRVPPFLQQQNPIADWAEAIFGFVSESLYPQEAYAGRVSVTSARVIDGQKDYFESTVTIKVLASPKPTTFQHYLEQPQGVDTPTLRLRHYGSESAIIRGHKLYWRQPLDDIRQIENTDEIAGDMQPATITPVRKGLSFTFKVHFDNLSDAELGALAWVLTLDNIPEARHQIGMGKPYGMGIVKLDAKLVIINRLKGHEARYRTLFAEDGLWVTGEEKSVETEPYIAAFKDAVQQATGTAFDQHERIKELKVLLQKQDQRLDYMRIEPTNDYDGRPVLPYPSQVKK
jgi:CRISPR-associated protein (TIGR03986 family)